MKSELGRARPSLLRRDATERDVIVRPVMALPPARASLRIAAYLVDWLVAVILFATLVSIGALQLYVATDGVQHDAPDASLYAFLVIVVLALPLWLLGTLAGWASAGRSVGKLAVGLRIVGPDGRRPGFGRSLIRLLAAVGEMALLLLAPLSLLTRALLADRVPAAIVALSAVVSLLMLIALGATTLSRGGRPPHDRLAGTVVVEE